MVNVRQKGARGETLALNLLKSHTGLDFRKTPGSGCGKIKGDIHLENGRFCIEVKNYAESHFNDKIFTNKTNNLVLWWNKLKEQAAASGKEPLLFFKYNRSKIFVATATKPAATENYVDIRWLKCYIILAEEWLRKEKIQWSE